MKETVDFKKLVGDAVNGNEKAFEALYHLTKSTAYQTAFRILQNEDDVQDAMQNAYIKANSKLAELKNPEKFESWLKSIVENECKNYIKKEKRISSPIVFLKHKTEYNSEEWREPIPQEYMEREELRDSVTHVLEKLSPETKACIVLFHFEDKTLEQIAEILDIPLGTVKSRLYNGRKQIEKEFNKLRKKDPSLYSVAAIPAVLSLFAYHAANSAVPATVSQAVLSSVMSSASANAATAAATGVAASAAGATASATGVSAAAAGAGATAAASGTAAATTGVAASIAVKIAAVAVAGSVVTGGSVAIKNYVETQNESQSTSAYTSVLLTEEEETLTVTELISGEAPSETTLVTALSSLNSTEKTGRFSTESIITSESEKTSQSTVTSTSQATTQKTTTATTVTTTAKPTTTTTTKVTTTTTTTTKPTEVTFTTKRHTTTEAETETTTETTTEATTNPEESYATSGGVITEYTGNDSGVSIPSTIGTDTVTAIGAAAFADNTAIRSVSIPSTVTQIGQEAFAGCTSLSSVSMPSSLEMIGMGAFYGCTSLTSVSIPDGTQTINDEAFADCSALQTVTIPESVTYIADDAFAGCDSLTVKCKEGSAAHEFAVANSVNFSLI